MDPIANNDSDWDQTVPKEEFVDGEKDLGLINILNPSPPPSF